jgi:HAD superfamily hydrolase (TIGR01509 family)
LLWDNDGVLVDTERCYFEACRDTLATVAIELTEAQYFDHWLASARGIAHVAAAHGISDEQVATLQRDRDAAYARLLERQCWAIDGVHQTLRALRPQFAMGIVTSSRRDHFEAIHRRTGFLEFFDFVLAAEDYARPKPDPAPYLAGIARTGWPPEACLAIEDAPRGLAAARAAGLDCWIVPTPLTAGADFSGATRVVASVAELTTLLC